MICLYFCFTGWHLSTMFKALDRVDYGKLKLNTPSDKPKSTAKKAKPLLDLACVAFNSFTPLLEEGIRVLPSHLAPKLLQTAIVKVQTEAVSAIIANWPLETLRLVYHYLRLFFAR